MLTVSNLSIFYGNIQALRGVSLSIDAGEIVTLIGANGAGKSTLLKGISRVIRPSSGSIFFLGQNITKLRASEVVKLGVSHAPEGRRIFPQMSVLENLEIGAYVRERSTSLKSDLERVYGMFPILKERLDQPGETLSGGEQQMLTIGRALMARPQLILLDEPSMGLAPTMVKTIFHTIRTINQQGTTVLLVEQNAAMALALAKRGYVIETGSIIMEDSCQNLSRNPVLRDAYLGRRTHK